VDGELRGRPRDGGPGLVQEELQPPGVHLPATDAEAVRNRLKPMVDEYVKRVAALGLPAEQIVADALALKKKYEQQYK